MQKRLFIIRHGKSSWESEVRDVDRPLTERGVRNSYDMADRLAKVDLIPEKIYSSTGIRALHTSIIMARVWGLSEDAVSVRESLYMSGSDEIDKVLSDVPEEFNAVAVYGHNPAFTSYANRLLSTPLDNLPTAGVVVLTFEAASWKELFSGKLVDEHVDCPRKK
jgi:phosphohistidine phosphatase